MRGLRPLVPLKAGALTVIALTLWLGGFGCSFCCAAGVNDACCRAPRWPVGESSSSQDICAEDSCCKPSASLSAIPSGEIALSATGVSGCSLLPAQPVSHSAEQRITGELAGTTVMPGPAFELTSFTETDIFTYPPSPRNRGATYLRCCVLLI